MRSDELLLGRAVLLEPWRTLAVVPVLGRELTLGRVLAPVVDLLLLPIVGLMLLDLPETLAPALAPLGGVFRGAR